MLLLFPIPGYIAKLEQDIQGEAMKQVIRSISLVGDDLTTPDRLMLVFKP